MGRSSAIEPLREVVKACGPIMAPSVAVAAWVKVIRAFEDYDCDCIEELEGLNLAFDKALKNCGYFSED